MRKVVILGAGISGLAAAWFLKKRFGNTIELTLHEKTERAGGWIQTHQIEGFLFEGGPRGFRPKGKGAATLELVQELGLTPSLVPANPFARNRYLLLSGKLTPFGLPLLLKQGLITALLRDLFTPRQTSEDETIDAFFRRRFNAHFAENLMNPLTTGIFGGTSSALSMRSCFPKVWEFEQTNGSVVKGFWKRSKGEQKKNKTPLYSFTEGMEMLPKTLAQRLEEHIVYNSAPDLHNLDADLVLAAIPAPSLAAMLNLDSPLQCLTLSTVSLGWEGSLLKKPGFGFLIPEKEGSPILGMTWDSEIFPHHNIKEQTRLCVMIRGEGEEKQLLQTALESVKRYLNLSRPPDAALIRCAKQAIPQYTLHHHARIQSFLSSLPPHVHPLGTSYHGVGVNDCIDAAARYVNSL